METPNVPGARNIAEWAKDQTRDVVIESWEPDLQAMTITARATQQPLQIQVMRIWLQELDGQKGRWEWNIAGRKLMAMMKAILDSGQWVGRHYKVTKTGVPPLTIWSIAEERP